MSHIAVVRMQNGKLLPIKDENDFLAEWETENDAELALVNHILKPLGFEYLEVGI
jgi:hypothetical protein